MTRYRSGSVEEDVTLDSDRWKFYRDLAQEHGVEVRDVQAEVLRRFADLDPNARRRFAEAPAAQPNPVRRTLQAHREQVRSMVEAGMSDYAIARELGFAQPSVSAFRRKHLGLESRHAFGRDRKKQP